MSFIPSSKLSSSTDTLRSGLLMSTAMNFVLLVLVRSMFEGTSGLCDDAATQARAMFRFIALFQVLVNVPVLLYYHTADKVYATESQDAWAKNSESPKLQTSFLSYLISVFIKFYATFTTVLVGPLDDTAFYLTVSMFAIFSAFAAISVVRFERSTMIEV